MTSPLSQYYPDMFICVGHNMYIVISPVTKYEGCTGKILAQGLDTQGIQLIEKRARANALLVPSQATLVIRSFIQVKCLEKLPQSWTVKTLCINFVLQTSSINSDWDMTRQILKCDHVKKKKGKRVQTNS